MFFNSLAYLCFFVAVFLAYWLVLGHRRRLQNAFILAASYFFYGMWDWRFLGLIMLSSGVDYLVGRGLTCSRETKVRRMLLLLSLLVNLGLLFVFKYLNFFNDQAVALLTSIGFRANPSSLNIVLPVGISFYTFQTLSYTIDVYRRKIEATDSLLDFFTYVAFFPQLVAGPIERAAQLLPQFRVSREFSRDLAVLGCKLILWGLFKKAVVADNCAILVDYIFGQEGYANINPVWLLLGAILFGFQIYGDFSGYSDIAIGSAKLLGFNLMINFRTPYFARDIPEFWRRWHISLTTWFRDYVYIPLGGSRGSRAKGIRNVAIVFVVSGIWHGANWTFLAWGIFSALCFLPSFILKRHQSHQATVVEGRLFPSVPNLLRLVRTFLVVCFGWVLFRAESIRHAGDYLGSFFMGLVTTGPDAYAPGVLMNFVARDLGITLCNSLLAICTLVLIEWAGRHKDVTIDFRLGPIKGFLFFNFLFLMTLFFGQFNHQEFIYFQF